MVFTDAKTQMILAILYFAYQIFAFFILGSNVTRFCSARRIQSIATALIIGYFIYYTLFECVALPMKIRGNSLYELAVTWSVVVGGVLIISVLLNEDYLKDSFRLLKQGVCSDKRFFGAFAVLILINFVLMVSLTAETMGVQDDSYYIADATTSLFTNTIQQYDYYSGQRITQHAAMYFIPMYPVHGAVVGKLLHLHPIIENKWCSVLSVLILSQLSYYLLAQKLLKGKKKKSLQLLYLMTFFHINYVLWGKASGTFFYYRLSEGKGILSNLIIPALILFFWEANESREKARWCALESVILGSVSICMSSLFLLPVAYAGLMAGAALKEKSLKKSPIFLMLLTPSLCALVVYQMMLRGMIVILVQ
ncbi:MAG: hypothetical protein HFI29_11105 [Lachnospiraceae bacterium]|jgi:hypothetical protein|nr:hypothetical protein [Lachnospiraceae bacterium]